VVYGVHNDDNRRRLLEVGGTLALDGAINLLRTAAFRQATDLRSFTSVEAVQKPTGQQQAKG
jgi:hypothetical protein